MLRLALAATLMSTAFGYTTQGDVMNLHSFWDTNIDTGSGVCVTQSVGATAGPVVTSIATATDNRVVVLGKCYELVTKILPMNNVFGVAGSNSEAAIADADTASGSAAVTTVSFVNNAGDVELIPYTGTYAHDCASMATKTAAAVSHGAAGAAGVWACDTGSGTGISAFSDGTALAANSYTNTQKDVNYLTVGVFTGHAAMSSTHTAAQSSGSSNGGDCGTNATTRTGAADEIFGSAATDGVASTAAGRTINFWPVAADKDEANPDAVAPTAPTAAEAVASRCYPHAAASAGAMQLMCDKETGNVTIYTDANDKGCIYGTDTGGNKHLVIAKKGDKCVAADAAGTTSWLIRNSDTEWDAVCSIPAQTATKEYFTGYLMATQADCATYGGAITIAAAENAGTRTVFLDTCYPTDANGQIPGFQGPFSAGTAATEPTAGKAAYMFVKTGAEIVTNQYAYSDCSDRNASGVATPATTLASDDPADSWCVSPAAISHGAVGTAGNAAAVLQTASNYLTVRKHTDDTGNVGVGKPGTCLGVNNVTSSTHLDYFRVGSTAAEGCHQSAAAASYSWWCDSSDYSINYGTWAATADCSGTQAAGALKFTKLAYDACAEADAADADVICTAAGPSTTIENPTTMTFSTVLTIANGATGDFGGKCLEQADNVSWEILSDSATWDAMCGAAPTPAPATTSTTSGAGKIAATAAAAAAAAALLL